MRQTATWNILEVLRRHGRHVVVDWPCRTDDDYTAGLQLLWGHDDLCILEHDLVPRLEHVIALETCPELVCTQAYELRFGDAAPVYAFRNFEAGALRWGREGDERAQYVGLGLTRVRRRAMHYQDLNVLRGCPWPELDLRLSELVLRGGTTAHVHWPAIAHHHS